MQSPHQWLITQVEKVFGKEELYNDDASDQITKTIQPVDPMLGSQIEFLYNALLDNPEEEETAEDVKNRYLRSVEEIRKETGPIMNRKSDFYFNYFAQALMRGIIFDGQFSKIAKTWDTFRRYMFTYNPKTKKKLELKDWIGMKSGKNVFIVTDPETKTDWIMKWDKTDSTQTANEEALVYDKLETMGAQCPLRLNGFYMLNFPVLILEFLQPLDETDDAIEMARQLLLTQLKYIHTFACYFDLKPDNIRKRKQNPPKYFLIDMELSTEALPGGGYKRLTFSALWTSQNQPSITVRGASLILSTYKNDLLELLYVVHQMIAKRAYKSKTHGFESNYNKMKFFNLKKDDFFADPEEMVTKEIGETARGWRAMKRMLEFPLDQNLSGITVTYMTYLNSLPNFPPPNVHTKIFSTLNTLDYSRFMEETQETLEINCQICSSISAFRCGNCYNKNTFLCSTLCAEKHECK